mgnify:FL=1
MKLLKPNLLNIDLVWFELEVFVMVGFDFGLNGFVVQFGLSFNFCKRFSFKRFEYNTHPRTKPNRC